MIVDNATTSALQVILDDASVPVVIDFWRPGCGPCRMLEIALKKLTEERPQALCVVKVNVEEEPALATQYNVLSTPTVVIVVDHVVVASRAGAMLPSQLAAWVDASTALG